MGKAGIRNKKSSDRAFVLPGTQFVQHGPNIFEYIFNVHPNPSEWCQWFLLRSDAHIDHPHSDVLMQERHLREAREKNARVLEFGDTFCAMQGRNDPRRSRSAGPTSADAAQTAYFNHVQQRGVDLIGPYADLFDMMAKGNHETGAEKNSDIDLLGALIARLNDRPGVRIYCGGYSGWIRFSWQICGTERFSRTLYYVHGSGGGGIVTKGAINRQRRQTYVNADIYVSGHIHHGGENEAVVMSLDRAMKEVRREILHIDLNTYKDGYADTRGGFEVEREHGPRPIGAKWLRMSLRLGGHGHYLPVFDVLKAR
jgi:hypothetical protein